MTKLDVHTRLEAAAYAARFGLISTRKASAQRV
jgi:DNA-binding NarL/FixJ family response regulator